jgi:DNA-binding NtrC family response regulator
LYGNVRELRNAMERAVLVGNFDQIGNELINRPADLRSVAILGKTAKGEGKVEPVSDMTLDEVEKRVILETLRRYNGNRTRTAEKLGISLRTLRNKLKAFRVQEGALAAEN